MKKLPWICPRCGQKNRLRWGKCRRCRARATLQRRVEMALLWAGAFRAEERRSGSFTGPPLLGGAE